MAKVNRLIKLFSPLATRSLSKVNHIPQNGTKFRKTSRFFISSVPLLTGAAVVYAAESTEKQNLVKVAEISLYADPEEKNQYVLEEEPYPGLRRRVKAVREALWEYMDANQETIDKVQDKWEISKAHTQNLIEILKDKENQKTIQIVSGSTIGGAVLGYIIKGRAIAFTLGLFGLIASICVQYPEKALEMVGYPLNESKSEEKKEN